MTVEGVHCLAVSGGLVVHNSDCFRYGIATRIAPARAPKAAEDKIEDRSPRRDWTKEGVPAKIVKPEAELDRLIQRDARRADRTTNPNRVRPRKW